MKDRVNDHSKYQLWIDPAEVKPYERNAKIHTDKQIDNICASIRKAGWQQDTVITTDKVLVIGHGRRLAAIKLGCMMPYHVIDKTADELTDEDIRELRIADNETNRETGYDFDVLEQELEDLDFEDFDFDFGMDADDEDEPEEEEAAVDDDFDPEPPEEPKAKLGDLYQLGNHRLICGDSTDPAVIDRLMDGVKADMVFTDPPYNVAIGSKNAVLNEMDHAKRGHRVETEIAGDKGLTDAEIGEQLWRPAFQNMADHAKDDCSIYVTMPQGGTHMMMMMMMADACWKVKHELMWLKNQPTFSMGRLDYDYKHEPIMYGWKKMHNFYGKGKFTKSVWEIDKPRESKLHPTMKPIELIANALENSTKENDCVLDVFGGSGSTLIACEQLNRKCYMCELDPRYCDVIVNRWEEYTGKKAVLLNGGE